MTVVTLTSAATTWASAQRAPSDASLARGAIVGRCAEASPAHREAKARLLSLHERIGALTTADPAAPLIAEVHGLLKSECFQLAAEIGRVPAPDSAASLKLWWEGGGNEWLFSYLELPRLGPADHRVPHIVIPPDTRRTLSRETSPRHPLLALLCPLTDAACGGETRGWLRRAEDFFATFPAREAERGNSQPTFPDAERLATCETEVRPASLPRYQRWRACIEAQRVKRIALPLGAFKAPTDGWFFLSGRRGHYEFCDVTTAFHLGTGATFIHESCSALALRQGGHVDGVATNAARVNRVRAGKVSVDNLREAVWMLLFREEREDVQLRAAYLPLPTELAAEMTIERRDDVGTPMYGGGIWVNSGQTQLTWRWAPPSGPVFVGEVTWPNSWDAAETHAAALIEVMEKSLIEHCPGTRITARHVRSQAPVLRRNANPFGLDKADEPDESDTSNASGKSGASGTSGGANTRAAGPVDETVRELDQDIAKALPHWRTACGARTPAR